MTLNELTHDQFVQVKQHYLTMLDEEGMIGEVMYGDENDERRLSLDELARADEIVPDDIIYRNYEEYDFTEDDFS